MQISAIHNTEINKYYINKANTNYKNNIGLSLKRNYAQYSAENARANYFNASFKGFKKAGKAYITDRDTGKKVCADIKREKIGDFISLKLMIGKEEAGYLDMNCTSVYPENEHLINLPSNIIPEIQHLRTISGDKYSGIGTALVKTAIQESWNHGASGNLWLKTEKGYARTYSDYRSGENPIPFYYKLGFESPDKKMNKFIKDCIKKNEYSYLPDSTILLLTPKAKEKMTKELCQNPIIPFKKSLNLY